MLRLFTEAMFTPLIATYSNLLASVISLRAIVRGALSLRAVAGCRPVGLVSWGSPP